MSRVFHLLAEELALEVRTLCQRLIGSKQGWKKTPLSEVHPAGTLELKNYS